MFKKSIACLIAVLMIVSSLPITVLADTASDFDDAKKAVADFNYTAPSGDYGSFAQDKVQDFKSGTNYSTYMTNVLYGQKGVTNTQNTSASPRIIECTAKFRYPTMVYLYDGIATLDTPIILELSSDNEQVASSAARIARRAYLTSSEYSLTSDTWYGNDQSDNWAWLYSNSINNDNGPIGTTTEMSSYIAAWNYKNKYYRFANMLRFTDTMSSTEYTKTMNAVTIDSIVSKESTSDRSTLTSTNTTPLYYVNYRVVLDSIEDAKTTMNAMSADDYSDSSL